MYLCLSVEISYAVRSNTNNEETGQCDVSLGVRLPACLPAWLLQLYEKFSKSRVHSANSVHIHYYCHNNAWCWWWYAIHVRRGFFFAVSTHRNDIFHWLAFAPKPAKEPAAILYSIHILIANRMNRALDQLDELCVWPLKFYEIEICFIPMD